MHGGSTHCIHGKRATKCKICLGMSEDHVNTKLKQSGMKKVKLERR